MKTKAVTAGAALLVLALALGAPSRSLALSLSITADYTISSDDAKSDEQSAHDFAYQKASDELNVECVNGSVDRIKELDWEPVKEDDGNGNTVYTGSIALAAKCDS